jgi:hypothetical protein
MMDRNTGNLVRDSRKGLIPYTTWAGGFVGLSTVLVVLILANILGLIWFIPTVIVALIWVTMTAHGFRHGWLK